MLMANTIGSDIFGNQKSCDTNHEVSREEIEEAIAKAVELRALHAALIKNSPAHLNITSASPISYHLSHFSAQDYPVFTPSYEDMPLSESGTLAGNWDCYGHEGGYDETMLSDYKKETSSNKGSHICPTEDQKSVNGSSTNNITVLQTLPKTEFLKSSRRNSLGDNKYVSSSSCNKCKPAIIINGNESSNLFVPLTDSHASLQSHSHSKPRGINLSWLFPRFKKKNKNENSPTRTEPEEMSEFFKEFGMMSIEKLKRELKEANENRDLALFEASEMRSSLRELKHKLEYLETYCEELKKALTKAAESNFAQVHENLPKRGKSTDGNSENLMMPVTKEVMVEGFLQIVSEARLSVKHFCKILVGQIEESDATLMENLNMLLEPYKLSLNSKYSKAVLYHLEAIINTQLYQDFENCVFQKNGSRQNLDPQQDRKTQFASFVALRNLSWNEVLRKGTKYYSEEFSKFCDQKMSCIISILNWTRPWPEQLLQAFFVAAKCIWLLHLLAFSFNPTLGILRVEENKSFDTNYMEDMFMDRQQRSQGPSRVKIMVMPGFYVLDRVLRCKVICRYKSVT